MAEPSQRVGQEEIEALLNQAQSASAAAAQPTQPAQGDEGSPPLNQAEIESLIESGASRTAPAASDSAAAADDSNKILGQGDIEALLHQMGPQASGAAGAAQHARAHSSASADSMRIAEQDIELLISQAERAISSLEGKGEASGPPGIAKFKLEDFSGAPPSAEIATIELVRDVELDLKIELGRTHMYLEDVLRLRKGSVVALDKLAGDPVDIYANGRLIARGEVLVLNDNFCVRVAELITGEPVA
jgi:flagellar motor switch protein FliN/FliY